MIAKTDELKQTTAASINTHLPRFYRLRLDNDRKEFEALLSQNPHLFVHDELRSQVAELMKIRNPTRKLNAEEMAEAIENYLKSFREEEYGAWVYYPWSFRLVHIVDKDEFIELRTSRNQYKITPAERDVLSEKKIGIIGLSVGQSIALTMAMERICGELRLADFDSLELTNLNRIRSGVHNIGVPKVVIAAREIAEIDPFINVKIFPEGLTDQNMDSFFSGGGNIDLLVEECDGIAIKILSRVKAKSLGIPVIMDTNDRGMLDIERFDLEADRGLFHGALPAVDLGKLDELSREEQMGLLDKMVGFENLSGRMKMSMGEIGKTITTWPQLASSVVLGGAMVTDVSRRILLNTLKNSGRYYVDLDEIIN